MALRSPTHAEHRGEGQRVGPVDERLLELAIHAKAVWTARPPRCSSANRLLPIDATPYADCCVMIAWGLALLGQRWRRTTYPGVRANRGVRRFDDQAQAVGSGGMASI